MSDVKRLPHQLDVCQCGDYRRDHENGTGRCKMPDDLTHGFQPCLVFRLCPLATFHDAEERREAAAGKRE
jgi:hypothetical protein